MSKGRALKNPNGYGSVVRLSGNRRKPYEVRVNTRIDGRGYPVYDVLERFEDRQAAIIALAEYNKNPYDIRNSTLTFSEVYDLYFERKYITAVKKLSQSSKSCTMTAYKQCNSLHNMVFKNLRTGHMQKILDQPEYSHATLEHIKNLFRQMYALAMEYDIVEKDWSAYIKINKEDDDEHGVPFSSDDIIKLWKNKDKPWIDAVLIYIYSGWRLTELLEMPVSDIDMVEKTFRGGKKTRASKNRIVPIHPAIFPFVEKYYSQSPHYLFSKKTKPLSSATFRKQFDSALKKAGIEVHHTPHDCRHTFATLLNNAGANPVTVKHLLGHSSSGDITIDIYTHKDLQQLRKAVELIKPPL